MTLHLIVGAGPTGSSAARLLAEAGNRVRLVSRRGTGPRHPAIELVRADATDTDRLIQLAAGARTIFNCVMPPYDQWLALWPPLAAAMLSAAERTAADYVMLGNTYGYGVAETMTENLPMAPTTTKGRVRAQMWLDALAAHQAGRVRVTEVRGFDYLGAGVGSLFNFTVTQQVLAGEPAVYPAEVDVRRAWTAAEDVGRAMMTIGTDERAWGKVWHVPSVAVISVRELAVRLAELTGSPPPNLTGMSAAEVASAGRHDPVLAEVVEMLYLQNEPLRFESTITQSTFGLVPSSLDDTLLEMAKLPHGS